MCRNTSTTGQRKNKQGPRMQAESNGIERMSQNLITLLDLCNNASHGIWTNNVSRRDGEPRPRRGGTPNTASRRRNTKQHSKGKGWLNTSRHSFKISRDSQNVSTDSRAHGIFSTREPNVAACVATSQRLAATPKQPNTNGWAESPK